MTVPFRIRLWDIGASRARGNLVAVIEDAADIGAAEYANEAGECFFTIPTDHPYISQIKPLERHIEISRLSGSSYVPIWCGLLDDYDADEDEVVAYGTDYLGLADLRVNVSSVSYTSTSYSDIVSDRLTAVISTTEAPLSWMTVGTVDSTSETTTVIGPHEPALGFLNGLLQILRSDDSTRPMIYVSPRTNPATLEFRKNRGSDVGVTLEYGVNVNQYRYRPGYREVMSQVKAIGQRREGASLLYSTQSSSSALSAYGWRQQARVFLDIISQTELDRRTKRALRRASVPANSIALAIENGKLAPWDGYDLGDSLTVTVQDGVVDLSGRYTVWGQEWIGQADGSELIFLDLSPKET